MFDCFFLRCVQVNRGTDNVADFIPADCFINRRHFSDTAAVYTFLKAITGQEFRGYQQSIVAFLESNAVCLFSSECFVEAIVETIVQYFGA